MWTCLFYLSGNKISSLPRDIFDLRKLKILYLFTNKIKSLPKCLDPFPSSELKILDLEENELSAQKEYPDRVSKLRQQKCKVNLGNQKKS